MRRRHKGTFVCMVAYTEYATDARIRREAETLAAHGFEVRCLALRTSGNRSRSFVLDGVRVQELPVLKYRGKSTAAYIASYLRFLWSASSACLRLLAKHEVDVVHVHNIPDFLVLAGLLPRVLGRKVVLDIHDSVPETFATKFSASRMFWTALCLEERLSVRLADKVICVNDPQRDTLVARGIPQSKTFVSMNVPDPRIFNVPPGRNGDSNFDNRFNLVYHGTMAERLGVDLLIRAVAELRNRLPCIRLYLWGHGDDLPAFQALARELELADLISFKPEGVPLCDLPRELRAMHLGVVGNRFSAAGELMLPVKLLEYVALDIPVVAPRLRAIQRYFGEDMVTYYEPGDVGSLADAVYRLHSQPDRRACQIARARTFLGRYGWERQGAELVQMYQSLVES